MEALGKPAGTISQVLAYGSVQGLTFLGFADGRTEPWIGLGVRAEPFVACERCVNEAVVALTSRGVR